MDRYDDLTPAQRELTERLVAEAYARHRKRCDGADRSKISESQNVLADELRAAYVEGRKAKESPSET